MDILISTGDPYSSLWRKRGSKYLSDQDALNYKVALLENDALSIKSEINDFVGNVNPLFSTEDLTTLICTEYITIDAPYSVLPNNCNCNNNNSNINPKDPYDNCEVVIPCHVDRPHPDDHHWHPTNPNLCDKCDCGCEYDNPIHSLTDHFDQLHTFEEEMCQWDVYREHEPEDIEDCPWGVYSENSEITHEQIFGPHKYSRSGSNFAQYTEKK